MRLRYIKTNIDDACNEVVKFIKSQNTNYGDVCILFDTRRDIEIFIDKICNSMTASVEKSKVIRMYGGIRYGNTRIITAIDPNNLLGVTCNILVTTKIDTKGIDGVLCSMLSCKDPVVYILNTKNLAKI